MSYIKTRIYLEHTDGMAEAGVVRQQLLQSPLLDLLVYGLIEVEDARRYLFRKIVC